jgi:hypothetical protein
MRMRRSMKGKNGYEGIVDDEVWGLISERCRRGRNARKLSNMCRIYSRILKGWMMNLRRQKVRVVIIDRG